MFENLTERLSYSFQKIVNKGRMTEKNITDTTREVRKAFLEADVALSVIKSFIDNVKKKSIGQEINKSLTPGQTFIKIVQRELITVMGEEHASLNLSVQPPAVILLVGLQGVGKTTSTAKLGAWIKEKYKKKILITSTDIYRAAAIEQLKILSHQINIDFFYLPNNKNTIEITSQAIEYAKTKLYDVLLIDTAGRLHINDNMMYELNQIQTVSKPIETLLTVDAMMGQDAINMAKKFNHDLLISGIILTKTDSDSRSGIALSMRYLTKKPIKFLGKGEKLTELEIFHPKRIASRILGMNNVISLIQEIEEKVGKSQFKKINKQLKSNAAFNLHNFLDQIKQIQKIGGLKYFVNQLPKHNQLHQNIPLLNADGKELKKIEAMICSMTYKERNKPVIIKGSRKRRIALGSGTKIQDVNKLLKNFNDIKKMMKQIHNGGMNKIIRGIKNMFPKSF